MRDNIEFLKFKLDKHNITCGRCIFEDNNIILIYYEYNNNTQCLTLYYNIKEKRFLYHYNNILTTRQKNILEKKILKKYKIK